MSITKQQEEMKMVGEVYEKLHEGNVITNNELNIAIFYFKILEDMLLALGPHFHLARCQISHDLSTLESFKESRQRG